ASSSDRSRRTTGGGRPGETARRRPSSVLREDELDHVFDRRLLDREVEHVLLGQEARGDARRLGLRNSERDAALVSVEDLAVRIERRRSVLEHDADRLVRGELV